MFWWHVLEPINKWNCSSGKVNNMFSQFVFENLILGLNGWIKENLVFPNKLLETASQKVSLFWSNCKPIIQDLVWFFLSFQFFLMKVCIWFEHTDYWSKPKADCGSSFVVIYFRNAPFSNVVSLNSWWIFFSRN